MTQDGARLGELCARSATTRTPPLSMRTYNGMPEGSSERGCMFRLAGIRPSVTLTLACPLWEES